MIDKKIKSILITSETFKEERRFWKEKVEGGLSVSKFPSTTITKTGSTSNRVRLNKLFDKSLTDRLIKLSKGDDIGLYIILLSSIQYLLRYYNSQSHVVLSIPRLDNGIQENGYSNTFLISDIEKCSTYKELLLLTQKEFQEVMKFGKFPVQILLDEEIREHTHVSLSNTHQKCNADLSDISFIFSREEKGLSVEINSNPEIYDKQYLEQVFFHLNNFLETVSNNTSIKLEDIQIITGHEEDFLLNVFNDTYVDYSSKQTTIKSAFEKIVKQHPNKIAIEYKGRQYTFQELNKTSNQLANYLTTTFELKPNDLVGIHMSRTENVIVSMLAVLKVGAAYVPLDPNHPKKRNTFIYSDSKMKLVLSEGKYMGFFNNEVLIDRIENSLNTFSLENLNIDIGINDIAYVIYTSGSTGAPKGVMISHGNVTNFFNAMDDKLEPLDDEVMLAVTTVSFDISVLELLWTLTRGISIVIKPSDVLNDYDSKFLSASEQQTKMDMSLFFFSSYNSVESGSNNKYQLMLDTVKFADENGFNAVWTPERHFHEFGGLYANPSVTSTAIAMITKNIQIRSGSVVASLHDPLRITEEWSMVDNLSNGRVGLSFASGWHADDFVLGGNNFNNRHETMYRHIDEVQRLWRGESVSRTNGLGKTIDIKTYPRPIQKELSVWITTGGSKETFISAGKIGANVLTHLLGQDLETLEENIKVYKKALYESGFNPDDGKVTLMMHTYMDNDIQAVKKVVKEPFCEYLRSSVSLLKNLAKSSDIDITNITSEENVNELTEIVFEKYWDSLSLMGTPETFTKMIKKLERIGVSEIACLIDFGVDEIKVKESLKKISEWKLNLNIDADADVQIGRQQKTHNKVTMMQTTPSLLKALINDPFSYKFINSLRKILIGGEALPLTLMKDIQGMTDAEIFNMYGPTETTVWSSVKKISKNDKVVSVGRGITNTQIYILNDLKKLVPVGVSGEVCIAGAGVSKGYLNNDKLTNENFIFNPFSYKKGDLLYRTGDIGFISQDGSLHIIGRKDNQVKLRGHRIELGEIEELLRKIKGVNEAVVILDNDSSQLVAYVESTIELDQNQLKEKMSQMVPEYMIPSNFIKLKQIPLSANGKIDRKKLTSIKNITTIDEGKRPTNKTEDLLLQSWKKVLKVDNIGTNDNFFHLGGDSIKAIQVASQLQSFGLLMQIKDLFNNPTIKNLSKKVTTIKKNDSSNQLIGGRTDLSPIQHWFFGQNLTNEHHYNHSVMLYNQDGWDEKIVEKVFSKIVEHHDVLRSQFCENTEKKYSDISKSGEGHFRIETFNLKGIKNYKNEMNKEANLLQKSLDIYNGPLISLGVFQTDEGDHLLIIIHHLVVDGVSWRILLEDFSVGYKQALDHHDIQFQNKTDSFQQWVKILSKYAQSDNILKDRAYWEKEIKNSNNYLLRDFETSTQVNNKNKDKKVAFTLNNKETQNLIKKVNKAYDTEINDILLSSLSLTLSKWTDGKQDSFIIDLEGHGREYLEDKKININRTVGWFTSLFPVNLPVEDNSLKEHILSTKNKLREIPNKGLSYGVLRYLNDTTNRSFMDLKSNSDIIFNYLGQFDQDADTDLFEFSKGFYTRNIGTENSRPYSLEINGMVKEDQLVIEIDYDAMRFSNTTIDSFVDLFKETLQTIVNHCVDIVGSVNEIDEINEPFPLTDVQMAYYLGRRDKYGLGGISPHNYSEAKMIIDIDRFNDSLNKTIERHPMLRAVFKGGQQVILNNVPKYKIEVVDITNLDENIRNSYIVSERKRMSHKSYNPEVWPLFEIKALDLGNNKYYMFISYDLLITDAVSTNIINHDLMMFYDGLDNQLPKLEYTFRDYILEYEEFKKSDIYKEHKSYWINKLLSFPTSPELKYAKKPTDIKKGHFTRKRIVFDQDDWNAFLNVALENEITPTALLCTAYAEVLAFWSNQPEMALNIPITNRYPFHEQVNQIVGEFTSLALLDIYLEGDSLFEDAKHVQSRLAEVLEHRHFDGVEFIREIGRYYDLPSSQAIMPIVFTSLIFNNNLTNDDDPKDIEEGIGVNLTSQTYLDCQVLDKNGQLTIWWDYVQELFEEEVIDTMFEQFIGIIKKVINMSKVSN
ncbi:MupA/Atu3671 family FMN-dependent luciferase-like monooxygenase [Bacillus sp. 105MF]|uniref:MupA/Atu3671 family FMN-dependent luciferase-like monooxygenase n=1 Tax=Bacillus sp. 105MF TaxID=1151120 RepID=UPI000370589C|nr:MupA/Atu3671 family FMN-dependent luciferase-like monooxygenase [Bacillus sp. 105MF]